MQCLPDRSVPDVARLGAAGRRLFIGDAKATETADDGGSLRRLAGYVTWCAAASAAGADVTVAVCCGSESDAYGWLTAILGLAAAASIVPTSFAVSRISGFEAVAWMRVTRQLS
jgi:hypothetical protein